MAVTPTADEMELRDKWVQSAFTSKQAANHANIRLLYEDVPDGITRGRSWRGTPFQLGDKTYTHGLAFNSTKHLAIHIGEPCERLVADVGLENNDDTRRGAAMGQGSVKFHVLVGGKEVFASKVLRLKDGPLPINVPLHGASEFEIRVDDGGDGRGWDQALWAGAIVKLESGANVRLQDVETASQAKPNPFVASFVLDGTPSGSLRPHWLHETRSPKVSIGTRSAELRSSIWKDEKAGLEMSTDVTTFRDFPAVEWVTHIKNANAAKSKIFESIQALDSGFFLPRAGNVVLHWSKGAVATFDDFAPQDTELKPGSDVHLEPGGGRSSSQVMPFFNLEGAGSGVIVAIGWTGEWAANFTSDSQGSVTIKIGQAHTRIALEPNEQIRTPRILLLFYRGDRWRGQNLWRQFILAHHRPKRDGKPLVAAITCGNWGSTSADVHLDNIQNIIKHKLPIEYYWIDAEWFGKGGWPTSVGDWTVKKDLYPHGFRPLSDALRKTGRELMLWFEPERVFKGTPWYKEHHDWLLGAGGENALLNLGNPQAREFLTTFISDRIDEFGLGCYRQDFNMDPLSLWQASDAPDRQGIAEIRHVEGLYAFWDELLKKHPHLMIDNCASGGRRIDLETIGRATPYWRSDGPRDPIAHQCHTYGLLEWVPLNATSEDRAGDDYEFRSSMSSGLCVNWGVTGDVPAKKLSDDFPFDWCRRTLEQYLTFRDFYYDDYYPLTSYSQARDVWMAYQLDRPDKGDGLVVALRRPDSSYEVARLPLRGLDARATYVVKDLASGKSHPQSGKELAQTGIEIRIEKKPGSALVVYKRQ
ncbi:MAG TPA: alpha-galactosidase [Lacipirellulaceae bacterium]|nr:alpha-galactosidase [Lacipirellulaceae bacterium]